MAQRAIVSLRARDLQPGDRCLGSGAYIVRGPQVGTRTRRGRVELIVSYRPGQSRLAEWNADTRLRVERERAA